MVSFSREGKRKYIESVAFESVNAGDKICATGYARKMQVIGLFAKSEGSKKLTLFLEDKSQLQIVHEGGAVTFCIANENRKFEAKCAKFVNEIDYDSLTGTFARNIFFILNEFTKCEKESIFTLKGEDAKLELKSVKGSLYYFIADEENKDE